eukprot:6080-Heterococcus_DN1.PRE.1
MAMQYSSDSRAIRGAAVSGGGLCTPSIMLAPSLSSFFLQSLGLGAGVLGSDPSIYELLSQCNNNAIVLSDFSSESLPLEPQDLGNSIGHAVARASATTADGG